jgi:predicted PurR-regulated permease PerM
MLLTVAAFVVVVAGMSAAKVILVPFLLAAFIAIISAPPLFWLRSKGLPTWLALLIVILGVLLIALLIAGLVGSSVKDFSSQLPVYEARLRQQTIVVTGWLEKLGVDVSGLAVTEIFNPGAAMRLVATLLNSLGNVLANGFLILMTVIFILLEASSFPAKLSAVLSGPEPSLARFDNFISNVKHYMAIKTLVSLASGILVAFWLFIIGVDYPLLWGLLAFALNYVPNIGSIIAAVPAVLLAVIQLGFVRAGVAALGYLVINLLMGSVIEPRFMGRGLGLSTLVVFLSLLFWGWVLGPVGMLLSVPLTITAKMALDSSEGTRWLAVLLGPETVSNPNIDPDGEPASEGKS